MPQPLSHSTDRKTAILATMAILGFGLLQAARLIDPGTGPYSHHEFALFGLFVDGCTFFTVAVLSYLARMENARVLFILGACASAVHVALSFADTSSMPLLIVQQTAAGMGWSLNVLCWMSVFVSYRPRLALPMIAGGYVINVFVPPLFDGLPISPAATLLLVYGCSIAMLFVCLRNDGFIIEQMRGYRLPATTLSEAFSRTRRAIAGTFVVSAVCGFMLESDALTTGIQYAQTNLTSAFCMVMALSMLAFLLIFRIRKANMDYILPIAVLAIASVLAARIVTGEVDAVTGSLMTSILISFYVLLWLMLISEAYERTLPAFFLLGLALAVARLSVLMGRLCAQGVQDVLGLDSVSVAAMAIWTLTVAVSLIFIAHLRYSSKMYRHLYDNTDHEDEPGAGAGEIDADARVQQASESAAEPARGSAGSSAAAGTSSAAAHGAASRNTATTAAPAAPAPKAGEHAAKGDLSTTPFDAAVDHLMRTCRLSERESQIIRDYAAGRSARYIAEWHMLSEHTVKTHLRRAYAKLDVHSRQELLDKIDEAEAKLHREA